MGFQTECYETGISLTDVFVTIKYKLINTIHLCFERWTLNNMNNWNCLDYETGAGIESEAFALDP